MSNRISLMSFTEYRDETSKAYSKIGIYTRDDVVDSTQNIIIMWSMPNKLFVSMPVKMELKLRYGNMTMESKVFNICKSSGYIVYKLNDYESNECGGCSAYRVAMSSNEKEIVFREHHLWTPVISALDFG